jgi:hypothetical protein
VVYKLDFVFLTKKEEIECIFTHDDDVGKGENRKRMRKSV